MIKDQTKEKSLSNILFLIIIINFESNNRKNHFILFYIFYVLIYNNYNIVYFINEIIYKISTSKISNSSSEYESYKSTPASNNDGKNRATLHSVVLFFLL